MKIDKFWVVTEPNRYEGVTSELVDILFEADWARMALQFWGGLKPEEIVAVFDNENEARQLAESLLGGKAKVFGLKLQGIKVSGLKRVAGVIKGQSYDLTEEFSEYVKDLDNQDEEEEPFFKEKISPSRLKKGEEYVISYEGDTFYNDLESPKKVTFTGKFPGLRGFVCDICGKEGRGSYEFMVGDPSNLPYSMEQNFYFGSECIKKLDIFKS